VFYFGEPMQVVMIEPHRVMEFPPPRRNASESTLREAGRRPGAFFTHAIFRVCADIAAAPPSTREAGNCSILNTARDN
jgi:hypothetical protein